MVVVLFPLQSIQEAYNGNTGDKGETATKIVTWDPSVLQEKGCCCYDIVLTVWDRAITNNYFAWSHWSQKAAFLRIC